ncbi:MAG: hypothetical protein WKF70_02410, partial [Chitinophagaceae bacterium]
VVVVVSDYSASSTGLTYSLGGNTYYFGNQSGTINNIQTIVGFSLPDGSYYYNVFVEGQIKIRRVNNPVVSGRRCLVWVEAVENAPDYRILLPYTDSMELFFNGQTLNKGTDNLFGNQGDGSGNNNNIERVDWIVPAGMNAANPAQSGFPIFERGADNAHDPFVIAAITSLDAGGNPASYGPILRVATAQYGNMANSALNWSILRKEEAEPRLYRTTAGVQRRGGVFVSLADLGVVPDGTVYGYSLFAHDLPASATPATLLDYTNAGFFPTNTSSNTTLGGIDLIAIAGVYNIAEGVVLPVRCSSWEATYKDENVLLKWYLGNKENCSSIYIEKSQDRRTWETIARLSPTENSFIDYSPATTSYYRLKFFRKGPGISYSDIRKIVANNAESFEVVALPGEIRIRNRTTESKNINLVIYNSNVAVVMRRTLVGIHAGTSLTLRHSLPKAVYFVEISFGNKVTTTKILVR